MNLSQAHRNDDDGLEEAHESGTSTASLGVMPHEDVCGDWGL